MISVPWGKLDASETSSWQSKLVTTCNVVQLKPKCAVQWVICKSPSFHLSPDRMDGGRQTHRLEYDPCINVSPDGQVTHCIWAAITAKANWIHTRRYMKPISAEIEITPLSRTEIQTTCSFRLLQSDWFTGVSYMRAEREAKEVGEERRRDGEGTEVTFTCRWSCSGLVLMMSAPPAVSLQSQSM